MAPLSRQAALGMISEAAAGWFVRLNADELSRAGCRVYLSLVKSSPAHVAAMTDMYIHAAITKSNTFVSPVPAYSPERKAIMDLWHDMKKAEDIDLALWDEDPVPVAGRIAAALLREIAIPESTLRVMARAQRQRRSKYRERIWWIAGIVATGVASPLLVTAAAKLIGS